MTDRSTLDGEARTRFEHLPEYAQLRQWTLNLSLVSHAPIQGYNLAPSENGKGRTHRTRDFHTLTPHMGQHHTKSGGTMIPRGSDEDRPGRSLEERMAWSESYHRRTVGYFTEQVERCFAAFCESGDEGAARRRLGGLRDECEATVKAWRWSPIPEGDPPQSMQDPRWKRYVALSDLDSGTLARQFGCSRRYINKIKAMDWSEFMEVAA